MTSQEAAAGHQSAPESTARRLRLALAQIGTRVGDLDGNLTRIVAGARAAHEAGAHIVCFPELAVTGYPPEDLLLKPNFVTANLNALQALAVATAGLTDMTIVIGFADRDADLYNAAALIRNGEHVGTYHKHFLPNYGVFDENRYFSAGRFAPTFLIDGVNVGVTICEDIWYPNGPPTTQAYAGAELLVNISASPFHIGKQAARERMLATRAADLGAIVAYCNMVGGQDELVFDGSSIVFDGQGELVARAKPFEDDLLVVELDVEEVFRTRLHDPRRRKELQAADQIAEPPIVISSHNPRISQQRPDVSVDEAAQPSIGTPGRIEPVLSRTEEAYRALVLGTRDYVRKNGFTDVVIGLSGGVDSALTATIAVDALGPEHVLGVLMPSRYSSKGSRGDAAALADNLGIRHLLVPIERIFNASMATLREPLAQVPSVGTPLTEENLQARIRGNILMALTNQSGSIVLTTGNKSEMAVGYATLYGDMAGGFAVLKDVFKTLVYDLARWRNQQAGHELIPDQTITKPPSAELRPDQKDSDSLPPYEVLDPILRAYVEEDRSFAAIVALGFEPAIVRRVMNMVDHSEYKRRQAPPGVKITARAFGRDRRLPISNAYHGEPGPGEPARTRISNGQRDQHDTRRQRHGPAQPQGAASGRRS